jgi:hypothetical protein
MDRKIVLGVASVLLVFSGIFIYSNFLSSDRAYAAVSYTWMGTIDSDWDNNDNWLPVGIPGSGDHVTIGMVTTNNPVLRQSVSVINLTINSQGVLELNGKTLTVTGTATINKDAVVILSSGQWVSDGTMAMNGGLISDSSKAGMISCNGSTTTFGQGSFGPTVDAHIKVNSSTVRIMNTEFNGNTDITKTGNSNDQSTGNNIFNGLTSITSTSTGYFLLSASKSDIFNNDVTFTSTGSGIIYPAYNGIGTQFNGNVYVNNSGSGGIRIGASAGTSELAVSKTISVGSSGFSNGMLMLARINFPDTSDFTINLPDAAVLTIGPGATFSGDVIAECGGLCLSGATYNGTATFIKTGTSNDRGIGGNIFNGTTSIRNDGKGYLLMSNNTEDKFNAEVTFTCANTGIIYPCYNGAGSEFNDNIVVNSIGTGGIRIGASSGTSRIADTKRVVVGTEGFSVGVLTLGNFTSDDTSAQTLTLSGSAVLALGPNSLFAGDITAEAGGFNLNGVTCNRTASFTKNGSSNDQGTGNNVFNAPVSYTNNGTGYFLLCNTKNDIYNAEVTFTGKNSGIIYPSYRGTQTQFNDNIIINSTGTGGVRIGASTGSSELAIGKRIIVGSEGFSAGMLTLGNFTSLDPAGHNLQLTGSAVLTLGPSSFFEGNLTAEAGGFCLSGTTFNSGASFTKNGSSNDQGTGNNIYNGPVSFTNNGTGYFLMTNTTRDIYNAEVIYTCSNSGIIYPCYRGVQTEYNDNIIVNSTGTGGVRIGASTGTSELAIGKRIIVGSEGFSNGMLTLGNFTSMDPAGHTITLTGSSVLTIGPSTLFEGNIVAEAGGICLNGATYNGTASFTKNGTSNDQGTGKNIFNGSTTFTNNGTGYFLMTNTTKDIFNAEVIFNCTNSGIIYSAYRGVDTEFNDDVIFNSSGSGGVRIGASTGTSILASSKKLRIGSSGFSSGTLMLSNFTAPGTDTQSLELTGSGILYLGPSSSFAGNLNCIAGGLSLSGVTIDGTSDLTKNGSSNDQGIGNNVFKGATKITNNGTGYLLMSSSKKDVFNAPVDYKITNSGIIYASYAGIGNEFNDNISVSSSGPGSIRFGASTGTSILADGKTISIGNIGFTDGFLQLNKFTQTANTPQTLITTVGTAAIYCNTGTTFNGAVNFQFPQVYLNGATFNNTVYIEKNGAGNNAGTGSNIFNAETTIKNTGTGILYLANSSGDDFNANVNFIQAGTGALRPAHNGVSTFAGDISTVGSTGVITFAASNGTVALDGSVLQNIDGSTAFPPIMRRLNISNGSGGVKLNVPVSVNAVLTLNSGVVSTTNTNLLIIENGVSTVNGVSNASYVDGPVRKVGTQAFTFPVGKSGRYRPISISAPSGATTHFTAEYFGSDPGILYNVSSLVLSIKQISRCEYWNLQRTNGTANVNVSLSWNSTYCSAGDPAELIIASWVPLLSIWQDRGNGSFTGNAAAGTIVSSAPVSSFGIFTLSSSNANAVLPVELVSFNAAIVNDKTEVNWTTASEINNDYFTIERSADGEYFEAIGTVAGVGNTTNMSSYEFIDHSPLSGLSFYRLRQTDYDGKFEVFEPVSVNYKGEGMEFSIESVGPNPFSNQIRIDYFSPENAELILVLSGLDGSLSYTDKINVNSGRGSYSTGQLPDLSSGVYILKLLKGEAVLETRKMVRN